MLRLRVTIAFLMEMIVAVAVGVALARVVGDRYVRTIRPRFPSVVRPVLAWTLFAESMIRGIGLAEGAFVIARRARG